VTEWYRIKFQEKKSKVVYNARFGLNISFREIWTTMDPIYIDKKEKQTTMILFSDTGQAMLMFTSPLLATNQTFGRSQRRDLDWVSFSSIHGNCAKSLFVLSIKYFRTSKFFETGI
jgi:hypothetical protein